MRDEQSKASLDLVVVAQIGGAHGVRGHVRVRSFTVVAEDCFAYGPLLDENGDVIFTAKSYQENKDGFVVWPVENRQREEWMAMKGVLLHVPRNALPEPEEDEFYFEDLIGSKVVHEDGRELGQVLNVHNFGADDLLELKSPHGTDYMLPFTLEIIPKVDVKAQLLTAKPEEQYLPDALRIDEPDDDEADTSED
ncbi:ribosome maturation factor RimM [Hirschia baltica]|uniref:Ribosome maturation factor RimM n=1 Tax=Hirschia baltica (strain ATCC 49814 / DSM 5838 / IFAM 1418) TaxID=582402 RepID=C6XN47_HIRBI|nr:ribosome maturation factor RimM [Hirschia baltica]ACT58217.1 16S rRNA processing protein RimM [Hirschia baltica ATCC 49814]